MIYSHTNTKSESNAFLNGVYMQIITSSSHSFLLYLLTLILVLILIQIKYRVGQDRRNPT